MKTPTGRAAGVVLGAVLLKLLPGGVLPLPVAGQVPEDVFVVGQVAEPRSLDPHAVTSLNDFRILVNLYEGLVRFADGTLRVEPALATGWTIEDAGRSYTFTLRPDVRFHDGTPFDAAAVRFNIERMLDPGHPDHGTGPFPLAFMLDAIARVEVIDPLTVRFELREPYAPLLSNLAYPIGLMVSPAAVREHGTDFGRNPSGTGPFTFSEWTSRRRVVLERNEAYHEGPPALGQVIFRPLSEPVTRMAELLTGRIDLGVELAPDHVAELRTSAEFEVHEAVGPHLWFLILNLREGPFRDPRLRLAANLAVDRGAIVEELLRGTAVAATGPIPEAFDWAFADDLQAYPHDPERARALVREAGYPEGVDVTFLVPQGGSGMLAPIEMATAIQADLAQVGIRARIETYEWNTYLARVNAGLSGRGDMAQMAWMTNDPHILPALALHSSAWPEEGGFNSGYYGNPELDRLLDEARVTADEEARAALYRQVQEIVREDVPWVVVASWRQNAVTSARVRGFRLQPSFFLELRDVVKR